MKSRQSTKTPQIITPFDSHKASMVKSRFNSTVDIPETLNQGGRQYEREIISRLFCRCSGNLIEHFNVCNSTDFTSDLRFPNLSLTKKVSAAKLFNNFYV